MKKQENPLLELRSLGQSCWLDDIRRDLIENGDLKQLIENDGLRGITSNPAIFEKAISGGNLYDGLIRELKSKGKNPMQIYEALSQKDVRDAADVFRPLYDNSDGEDGFVSLEVNPHLAYDTDGTVEEAIRLWKALDRPNVMIKVPATKEGLPAITELISAGINVNVTLIFGLPRYQEVIEAYLNGMVSRMKRGKDIHHVAGVASFFLSRIDVLVNSTLDENRISNEKANNVRGRVAIASARIAYQMYKQVFHGSRFRELSNAGARAQRLLWASTGTKDPKESDVKYIEPLIGPETVSTMPMATLQAFRDHGRADLRLEEEADQSLDVIKNLSGMGIDLDRITRQLEDEGVEKFNKPFDKLIMTIKEKVES